MSEITLRDKLIEIMIKEISDNCFDGGDYKGSCADAILSLLKEELPEEQPHVQFLTEDNLLKGEEGARTIADWRKKGWNECRQEMLDKLGGKQ